MVSKEKYLEVNGLEEDLQVAFNDVDFNLKLLKQGYYNICLNHVELYHHESNLEVMIQLIQVVQNIADLYKNMIISKINGVICYIMIDSIILI